MMGAFSRLGTETTPVDDTIKSILQEAGVSIQELHDLVKKRHKVETGVASGNTSKTIFHCCENCHTFVVKLLV